MGHCPRPVALRRDRTCTPASVFFFSLSPFFFGQIHGKRKVEEGKVGEGREGEVSTFVLRDTYTRVTLRYVYDISSGILILIIIMDEEDEERKEGRKKEEQEGFCVFEEALPFVRQFLFERWKTAKVSLNSCQRGCQQHRFRSIRQLPEGAAYSTNC